MRAPRAAHDGRMIERLPGRRAWVVPAAALASVAAFLLLLAVSPPGTRALLAVGAALASLGPGPGRRR